MVCAGLLLTAAARAEPNRAALVMGNATYAPLPRLTACARSANLVAAAARAPGFEVTRREDASIGAMDAAINEFSQRGATGQNTAFIYVCGQAIAFNDRVFLLPAGTTLTRPSDVLTQGILAKTLLNAVNRDSIAAAVVVLDLSPPPDTPPGAWAAALAALPMADGVGFIAVAAPVSGEGATPLAAALVSGLGAPTLRNDTLLADVRARLTALNVPIAFARPPVRSAALAGAAPAPEPVKPLPVAEPVKPAPVAEPVKPEPARPVPVAEPVKPPPAPVTPARIPDENQMTEVDRRKVQSALMRLNLYDKPMPVNGKFGPETRVAIRRYQLILGVEMTGHLTAAQASQLVSAP